MKQLLLILPLLAWTVQAGTIDFEQFKDGEALSNQVSGLLFENTTVATSGISLNEVDFPPHSGSNLAFDSGGPIVIFFNSPISSFSGYFTYTVPLTIQAFDAGQDLLTTAKSKYTSNLGSSGDPGSHPNEFLQLSSASPITEILMTASALGTSFTMDDTSYEQAAVSTIPEPSTLMLFVAGLGCLLFKKEKQ